MEPNEPTDGSIGEAEIFRLSSRGGVEIRFNELPIVEMKTNGTHGHEIGVPFDSAGLRRFARYLERYADRLDAKFPAHADPKWRLQP